MLRSDTVRSRIGATLLILSSVVAAVFLFQPWRSCPYEDAAAGCAMLTGDAVVLTVAVAAGVVGLLLVIMDYVQRR